MLGGAFLLFKKYREQIVGVVANIFETLEGWYSDLNSEGDPIKKLLDNIETFFNESVFPTLKDLTINFLKTAYSAVAAVVNSILPFGIRIPTDLGNVGGMNDIAESYDMTPTTTLQSLASAAGGADKLGGVRDSVNPLVDELVFTGAAADTPAIQAAVKAKLEQMYDYFSNSGGRIQWTNIGEGFKLVNYKSKEGFAKSPFLFGRVVFEFSG